MHGMSARHEVRLGMWQLRALTGASRVCGARHVTPALRLLARKAAASVLLLPDSSVWSRGGQLGDLAPGTGLAATGSCQVLRVAVGEL